VFQHSYELQCYFGINLMAKCFIMINTTLSVTGTTRMSMRVLYQCIHTISQVLKISFQDDQKISIVFDHLRLIQS
jgi:hypothetical protein